MILEDIKKQFPILSQKINGKNIVYLDNAASTQKPIRVIDTVTDYYKNTNSNIHRGNHYLSQKATTLYEQARQKVQKFINAKYSEEVIFTKGTTESINLLAQVLKSELKENDEIILSIPEHHSNVIPWQIISKEKKLNLKFVELTATQEFDFAQYKKLLNTKTKIVSIQHISNSIGNINPVEKIIYEAKKYGAITILDAAQSVPHKKVDVQKLDCDFIAFTGQKMYSYTGIGILYGKRNILQKLSPYQVGGGMVKEVFLDYSTYADLPTKYEAGTPNISGAISLGEAIDFIDQIGIENIENHEKKLYNYAVEELATIKNLEIYGGGDRTSTLSFNIKGIHNFDLATILDKMGIAVRAGSHCAQLLMKYLNVDGTVRVSFAVYNVKEDIDYLKESIEKAKKFF